MTPVVLVVDAEPDGFFVPADQPSPWDGFQVGAAFLEGLRGELTAATGHPARFAWFFRADHQVERIYGEPGWALQAYEDQVQTMLAAGDEVGAHPHAYRHDEAAGGWVLDYGDPAWVRGCAAMNIEAVRAATGRCTSFRYGERWTDGATSRWLATQGITVDLTCETGRPPGDPVHPYRPSTGRIPDQRQVPPHPYLPDAEDPTRPARDAAHASGAGSLLAVPITTASIDRVTALGHFVAQANRVTGQPPVPSYLPASDRRSPVDRWASFRRRLSGTLAPRSRAGTRASPHFHPWVFRRMISSLLPRPEGAPLALLMRSSDFLSLEHRRRLRTNLLALAEGLVPGARFVTAEQAARTWRDRTADQDPHPPRRQGEEAAS